LRWAGHAQNHFIRCESQCRRHGRTRGTAGDRWSFHVGNSEKPCGLGQLPAASDIVNLPGLLKCPESHDQDRPNDEPAFVADRIVSTASVAVRALVISRNLAGIAAVYFCGSGIPAMAHVKYEIVEHDGGWAYKVGDVFSGTFATHDQAMKAAKRAAHEQAVPGETSVIEYQDKSGRWRTETARGGDRPDTEVEDDASP
jgi:hypothetical protein